MSESDKMIAIYLIQFNYGNKLPINSYPETLIPYAYLKRMIELNGVNDEI